MSKQLEGCCDACGVTGQNEPDEIICRLCKLKHQAAEALRKDWIGQYHMIQGMIRDEEKRRSLLG